MTLYKSVILAIVLLFKAVSIYAFEYKIEKTVLEGFSVPGHETITSMAIECLNRYKGQQPTKCLSGNSTIGLLSSSTKIKIPGISDLNAQELMDSSSFPDDPGRFSDGYMKGIKGLASNESHCIHGNWYNLWLDKNDYTTNITGGLFCNSHYGVLQFWHAMASRPMEFENYPKINGVAVEPFDATLQKILAWSKLTYQISIDDQYRLIEEPYCQYFNGLKTDPSSQAMANSFVPDSSSLPEGMQFHCDKKHNGEDYTVAFLFENACTGYWSATNCTPIGGGNKALWQRGVQLTALGALIHLVQDSYSVSHVLRQECDPNSANKAKVNCSSVKGFMSYREQDSDKHTKADIFPIDIDSSCDDGVIDDVVTATARVLWHVQHGKTDYDVNNFIAYLKESVFKSAYENWKDGPLASSGGECFAKT